MSSIKTPLLKPLNSDKLWNSSQKKIWVFVLFSSCAVLYMARVALPISIANISNNKGWSKKDSGMVLASFFWGYALTQILGGYLSDRFGGEKILFYSVTGWALLTIITPEQITSTDSLVPVVFCRVLVGALQGVHFPAIASLVSNNLPTEEKSLFMGIVTSGPAIGMLISGSVGSIILQSFHWSVVFRVVGLFAFLWVLLLHYSKSKLRGPKPLYAQHNFNTPVPWLTLFRKAAFWAMLFAHLCETNAFFILLSWLPSYFHESFPEAKGWVFNVVPWLISPPASIFAGWLADRLISKGWRINVVRKTLESACHLTKATFFILLIGIEDYGLALLSMSLIVASGGFHCSGVFMNPQDIAPQYAGSVFGLMNTMGSIPGFLGVYMTGYVLETSKSWSMVFLMTAILNLSGCLVFLIFGTAHPIVPLPPQKI